MRRFGIVDMSARADKRRPCATLLYDKASDTYEIEIEPWATEDEVPMLLIPFVHRKQRTLGSKWSRIWVEERIVPPSRQNLGQVLKANGLDDYDSFKLLLVSMGRCCQDDFALVDLDDEKGSVGAQTDTAAMREATLAQQVGHALAQTRKEAGLTQVELAQRVGVQQSMVSRIERGKGNPTVSLIEQLSLALDCKAHIQFVDDQKNVDDA